MHQSTATASLSGGSSRQRTENYVYWLLLVLLLSLGVFLAYYLERRDGHFQRRINEERRKMEGVVVVDLKKQMDKNSRSTTTTSEVESKRDEVRSQDSIGEELREREENGSTVNSGRKNPSSSGTTTNSKDFQQQQKIKKISFVVKRVSGGSSEQEGGREEDVEKDNSPRFGGRRMPRNDSQCGGPIFEVNNEQPTTKAANQRGKKKGIEEEGAKQKKLLFEVAHCPEEDIYLLEWRQRREASHHWVLVDVGANKGYSIAGMLGALGVASYSKRALASELFQYAERENALLPGKRHMLCGACCECTEEPLPSSLGAAKGGWEIHAFDGTKSHVDFLNYYFQKKRDSDREVESANVTVYHMAVGSYEGTISFPQGPLESETSAIGGKQNLQSRIPLVTLDRHLAHLPYIDLLLTDAEGFDFQVAKGAKEFFLRKKVGIYVFELGVPQSLGSNPMVGRGSRTELRDLLSNLEEVGYVCYFPLMERYQKEKGLKSVLKISQDCWDDVFHQIRGWVNAVCIQSHRHPELLDIFEQKLLTTRPAKKVSVKSCEVRMGLLPR